jgi:multiple sugar transport system ATP-binding protein
VLNQGRVQQIGAPQTIYSQPSNRMVATFLGSPPMNILPVTYDAPGFQIGGQMLPCPEFLQQALKPSYGEGFSLGIRPEHIQISDDIAHLRVEAEVVEPLGRETLVRAVLLAQNTPVKPFVNLRVEAQKQVSRGDRLSLQSDFSQIFVFDPATGDRLYPAFGS